MGSVAHVPKGKKDLAKAVHILAQLGFRLENSPNGGYMVDHNSELSLVVELKSKQYLDTLRMIFRKFNESFSQGKMGYLGTKVDCVCRMLMT